jgi:hypothetical protein
MGRLSLAPNSYPVVVERLASWDLTKICVLKGWGKVGGGDRMMSGLCSIVKTGELSFSSLSESLPFLVVERVGIPEGLTKVCMF